MLGLVGGDDRFFRLRRSIFPPSDEMEKVVQMIITIPFVRCRFCFARRRATLCHGRPGTGWDVGSSTRAALVTVTTKGLNLVEAALASYLNSAPFALFLPSSSPSLHLHFSPTPDCCGIAQSSQSNGIRHCENGARYTPRSISLRQLVGGEGIPYPPIPRQPKRR